MCSGAFWMFSSLFGCLFLCVITPNTQKWSKCIGHFCASIRPFACPHSSSMKVQKELRWGKSDLNLYPLALALPAVQTELNYIWDFTLSQQCWLRSNSSGMLCHVDRTYSSRFVWDVETSHAIWVSSLQQVFNYWGICGEYLIKYGVKAFLAVWSI